VFVREQGDWSQQAYVKASNTDTNDQFGYQIALSGDGNILAVGASQESSNATGIDGNQADNSAQHAGAAYVFVREQGAWSQQAYIKASNTDVGDRFGTSIALSGDGNMLAVGAGDEGSNATGIDGDQADNSAGGVGAVYVFVREQGAWSQQAYVKPSNSNESDHFGNSLALSGDGSTLAVGAIGEDSNATGIDGDQLNNFADEAGAVYVFVQGQGAWSQQAYIKASNTGAMDQFGLQVALSGGGNMLAVGVAGEDSNATGIGGNQADNSMLETGAAYVFVRDQLGSWSQQAYVKASNTEWNDYFGGTSFGGIELSADGATLAVAAVSEDSNATGIGGNQGNFTNSAGAVYLY
jgi:hypothetical protein